MALDGLIFDVDGTLIDSNDLHVEAFRRAFDDRGYKVAADRINIEIGKGGDNLVPAILGPSADEKDGNWLRERQPVLFAELAEKQGLKVFRKAKELMSLARRNGLTVIVATSSGKKAIQTMERVSGFAFTQSADVVVTTDDADASKPAPDLIAVAAKKAKLSPAQCAMVGDSIYDARSAKRAGVVTASVLSGRHSQDDLYDAGARRVFKDVADIHDHFDDALKVLSPGSAHLTTAACESLMAEAIKEAQTGLNSGELPVGSVIARGDGSIVARGFDQANRTGIKTNHAERTAFTAAAGSIDRHSRDTILVSTLEPCVMCLAAAMVDGVDTVLFGLHAPSDSGTDRVRPPRSPDSQMPRIVGDILAKESLNLFRRWYADNKQSDQAPYVKRLLELHKSL